MRLVIEAHGPPGAPIGWVEDGASGQRLAFSGWLEFLAAVEAYLAPTTAVDEEGSTLALAAREVRSPPAADSQT